MKQQTKVEKLEKLKEAGRILKTEFVGLDSIIDEILKSISPWYVTPEVIKRPVTISLWGMTGTGKTSIVRRITELLEIAPKTVFFDCGLEANESSTSSIADKVSDTIGLEDMDVSADEISQSMVFVFDEFQYARTLDESGTELLKSNLRPIWNIIDNGILNLNEYRYSIGYFANFVDDLSGFSADHPGFTITEGQVCGEYQIKEFINCLGLFYCNRNAFNKAVDKDEEEELEKPIDLIESSIWRTLVRKLNAVKPQFGYKTAKEILKKTDLSEIVEILQDAKAIVMAPRTLDCSKSLIFILGNLDEAFKVEDDISPDMDADIFYDITSKVTVTDIKEALKKRFRAEQIARFGNNLIKYPTLKKDSFIDIIKKELSRIFNDFEKSEGLAVEYTPDIVELMYSEGVYPVQGVRPVLTTIGTLITPLLSDIVIAKGKEDTEVTISLANRESVLEKCKLKVPEVTLEITFPQTGTKLERKIPLQLGALRDPRNRKTRYICSLHEAGHAIVALYLTGRYPDTIMSVATNYGGFVTTHDPDKHSEIGTREDIDNKVCISLAGYEAESMIFSNPNKRLMGSGNDIEVAWETLSKAVYECGYFEPYRYSCYTTETQADIPSGLSDSDNGTFRYKTGNGHRESIRNSVAMMFGELRKHTWRILEDNKKLLVQMALRLGESGSMGKNEFSELIAKYGGTLNPKYLEEKLVQTDEEYWYHELLKASKKLGE